jgi:GT2 family glycosyltransferase
MSGAPQNNDAQAVELTIIVVSFGTREMTLQCLDSVLLETKRTVYEIIIVDNASQDGSAEAVGLRFPAAKVLPQQRNLGFGAACNLAAREARGRYLLLLNPDTIVRDAAIDRLVGFAHRRPQAGIWGGRMLFADGTLNAMSCWRRQSLWNLWCRATGLATLFRRSPLFHSHTYAGWDRDSEREVDIVSGGFLLIEKSLWDRLSGFAPEFFLYGEDSDLCIRARALGYRPLITPEATIIHESGGTQKDDVKKIAQILAVRALLIQKYFPRGTQSLALLLLACVPFVGQFSGTLFPRETWRSVWRSRGKWLSGQQYRLP